ncbi:IS5 family transposase [Xanthomonas translucens]|uniref:IS5 family transposase n=4 Tax=Xanthomonas campestris pv. translucens TaxID=343 RepID=UPI001F40B270|nr:IS5 family transposase [Xanthomonas translucens]UJB17025.1 IS5 family transposase [Xanthomonas translucens pv. undulosa]WLA02928.1 IS5 family transposase [Xanthomonas translucens]
MQLSFSDAEHAGKRKRTRREVFLAQMDQVVPWSALLSQIAPHYPKAGRGRHPYGLETMLRIHFLQQWYALSDPAMEEARYEIASMRQFARVSLLEAIPDETTILNFRHFLERHGLAPKLLEAVNRHLQGKGLLLRQGTIMDATLIEAPSSTKNSSGTRDPAMHQTKKGQQWFFGMKAHVVVDRDSGLVHTVVSTAANVADVTQAQKLLHGQEREVYADAGYTGADKREELKGKRLCWNIAERRSRIRALPEGELKTLSEFVEHLIAKVRARVEHPFRVIKRQFGHRKVRYRGLAKNDAQLNVLFALLDRPAFRRHPVAIIDGNDRGVYGQQQAVHG